MSIQLKDCQVVLTDLSIMKPKSAALLKSKLQKWKAESGDSPQRCDDTSSIQDTEPADNDLQPAQLFSSPAATSTISRPVNVDLNNLLSNFQKRKPKVELKTKEIKISAREADQETEELRARLRRERGEGKGAIRLLPPGISWLRDDTTTSSNHKCLDLSSLPVNITETTTARDRAMLDLLKTEVPALHLVRNISMNINLVTDKHLLLTNMFYAMCLHTRQSVIESTKKCLIAILSHSYTSVDDMLNTWVPRCKNIKDIISSYGAGDEYGEVGATPEDDGYKDERTYSSTHPRLNNLKAMVSVLTTACKYRKKYTDVETIDLVLIISKLSLDKNLICTHLKPDICSCIHALIAAPNDIMFSHIEPPLCERLLYLVSHHHNKLYVTSLLPALSERCNNLRQFLAYLTVCQLVSADLLEEISIEADTEWSIRSLTHQFFRLDLTDSADMYYLYSVMSLCDVVVGSTVDTSERDDLDVMRAKLSKQCRIWRESPLRPDITKTKNLLHRISLRWQYLVQQATAIDEVLDIKYKPTPTKIIPVCSQEVRDDDDVDEDEMQVDTEGGDSQSDSGDTTSPASNHDKGKRPMNPNKSPVIKKTNLSPKINLPGLEKLRTVARDVVARSSSQSPCSSRANTPSRPHISPDAASSTLPSVADSLASINISGGRSETGVEVRGVDVRQAEQIPPLAVCKALDFADGESQRDVEEGDSDRGEQLSEDGDDLPDLD